MKTNLTNAQRSLLGYYRRSRALMAKGLTTRGLPRQRVRLTAEEDKARRLARWHARSRKLTDAGLTTRGNTPVYRPSLRRSWKRLRATIQIKPSWYDIGHL